MAETLKEIQARCVHFVGWGLRESSRWSESGAGTLVQERAALLASNAVPPLVLFKLLPLLWSLGHVYVGE